MNMNMVNLVKAAIKDALENLDNGKKEEGLVGTLHMKEGQSLEFHKEWNEAEKCWSLKIILYVGFEDVEEFQIDILDNAVIRVLAKEIVLLAGLKRE